VTEIRRWGPDGIVCDESQYIAHHTSQRSRSMHRLGDLIDSNKIIMSGTPISKSPLNIYSQYRFLDKTIFGTRWADFREKYAIMGGYMGYEVKGIRKPKLLAKKIKTLAVRAKKEKEAKHLPEKTFIPVPFELSERVRRIYNKMAKDAVVQFKSGKISTAEIGVVKLMRFQQITGGFLKDEDGNYINIGDDKLRILDDLLETLEGNKVVIFARFKREIRDIKNLCKRKGLKSLVIKGGVSGKKREERIKNFREKSDYKAIIFQVASGTAVDLTVTNIAIFYSMDYSPEHFIQCQDRIHRNNQKYPCMYYILMARNTVDYAIYNTVKSNIHISELILDKYEEIIGGNLKI
jgi:SNF2 family DNA or RNA helicase